jgi:hypothetical protein
VASALPHIAQNRASPAFSEPQVAQVRFSLTDPSLVGAQPPAALAVDRDRAGHCARRLSALTIPAQVDSPRRLTLRGCGRVELGGVR